MPMGRALLHAVQTHSVLYVVSEAIVQAGLFGVPSDRRENIGQLAWLVVARPGESISLRSAVYVA